MSKVSFRARALDSNKRMPILRGEDISDELLAVMQQAVTQLQPSVVLAGMEKEEESVCAVMRPYLIPSLASHVYRFLLELFDRSFSFHSFSRFFIILSRYHLILGWTINDALSG